MGQAYCHRGLGILVALLLLVPAGTFADDAVSTREQGLLDLSLAELMDVQIDVPASITETDPLKTPASVTVITAEDIAQTPARNILDLLEVYVPGAIFMNHSVGPLPGIRGILVDRPYKFLVNVNGVSVNIKSHYGARLELVNWDLNDIARIEIVRGPGSVTYGPGAIGGVINIYTKTAKEAPGIQMGTTFWDQYNSLGNHLSYGHDANGFGVYGYASVVNTDGVRPDLYAVSRTTSGYIGSPGGPSSPNPPATYMSDFYDEPQIKAHVDLHLKDDWRIWARYVTSSSELMTGSATQFLMDGQWQDFRQTRYRYAQLTAENHTPLADGLRLESTYGLSSIDVHNVEKYSSSIVNDRDSLQNIGWIWSEHEFLGRWMLSYAPQDEWTKAAAGFEISYDMIRPGWGKDQDNGLRLSDGIISGPSSDAYGAGYRQVTEASATYFAVGEGWETVSYAFLGELNARLNPRTTTVLSARVDKHDFTEFMFSPRFAALYELHKDDYLKFIAQRSVRMNTQEELYMSHVLGEENDPEKLDTLEFIYSGKLTQQLSFQTSVFFNQNDVIAWDWAQARSAPVGTLQTAGLEVETEYRREGLRIGLNHSFVKQLDWDLDDGVLVSGISYSDYYQDAGSGVIITSNGNDLNNWPNHATKLFTSLDLLDGRLRLHGNLRTLWGFEGSEDGLDALERAGGNAAEIADVRQHDAYAVEITANVSLTWRIDKTLTVTAFVQNIPVLGDNKRYAYSSGFKNSYPDKVSWVEEPTVLGVSCRLAF